MKTVSVIMPCYNDGAYIEEAVASVRAQTYPEIELIIIDDGSTDDATIRAIERLSQEPRTKVIHTDHLRPAGARNAGIAVAAGKYIMPVDADDVIEPTYIEKAVAILDEKPEVGVVYCHADLFGERSGDWGLPDYSLEHMLVDNVVFVTALFRWEDWETVGGFRTTMRHGLEDYDFWLGILELGREIVQLPELLFHYRIKPNSRTTQFWDDPKIVKETYRDIYRQHPALYERYKDLYATVLRNIWVDRFIQVQAYEKQLIWVRKLKQIPFLKTLAKKILLKQ